MSLQLQLFLDYIKLKASGDELQLIQAAIQGAARIQQTRYKVEVDKAWNAIYDPWYENHQFKGKFKLRRYYGYIGKCYYSFSIGDKSYVIKIIKDNIEINLINTPEPECECRIYIEYDGKCSECYSDGCQKFDEITQNPENIQYILDFVKVVHEKLKVAVSDLWKTRLD